MHRSIARTSVFPALTALVCAVVIGACGATGGSSGASGSGAMDVLQQTFTGSHEIQSGVVHFSLAITPSGGSGPFSSPFQLTVDGPFQSVGAGRLPAFDLTAGLTAFGQSGSAEVVFTGSAAYLTFGGTSYAVPAGAIRQLLHAFVRAHRGLTMGARQAFASRHELAARARRHHLSSSHVIGSMHVTSTSAGLDVLSSMGLHPLQWLVDPTVVSDNVTAGGVPSTEVQSGVDLAALVRQLHGAMLGSSGHGKALHASLPSSLLAELGNVHPTVEVFSGNADRALRKLVIDVTVPVSGPLSARLGGLTGAHVVLTLELDELNQPQTITAPSAPQPFDQLRAKLAPMLTALSGMLGNGSLQKLLSH